MVYIEHEKYLTTPGLNFSFHGIGLLKVELLVQRFSGSSSKEGPPGSRLDTGIIYTVGHTVFSPKRTVLCTFKGRKSLKSERVKNRQNKQHTSSEMKLLEGTDKYVKKLNPLERSNTACDVC